jgi:hypothetical protein
MRLKGSGCVPAIRSALIMTPRLPPTTGRFTVLPAMVVW